MRLIFTVQNCDGGMFYSLNELMVCNPFNYIPNKNFIRWQILNTRWNSVPYNWSRV